MDRFRLQAASEDGLTDARRAQGLERAQLNALADFVTGIGSDSVKPPLDFGLFRVLAPRAAGARQRSGSARRRN